MLNTPADHGGLTGFHASGGQADVVFLVLSGLEKTPAAGLADQTVALGRYRRQALCEHVKYTFTNPIGSINCRHATRNTKNEKYILHPRPRRRRPETFIYIGLPLCSVKS